MNTNLHAIFERAYRELRPRSAVPELEIEFFPFAGLNHTARLHENRLMIRVSDIFTDAPADFWARHRQALSLRRAPWLRAFAHQALKLGRVLVI